MKDVDRIKKLLEKQDNLKILEQVNILLDNISSYKTEEQIKIINKVLELLNKGE